MNFSGFKKMKFNGLRESRAINFDDLQKNVVEFSVLDKINFDDLQEKRWRDEF